MILGGGTGGTMTANRLRRRLDADEVEIHVVDGDDRHAYQRRRRQSCGKTAARPGSSRMRTTARPGSVGLWALL